MYTYKLYFFVLYLLSFWWSSLLSVSLTEATKTKIIYDLRKLKEHGTVTEAPGTNGLKDTTFETPADKVVEKVVYDTADVWVAPTDGSKVLKKLVVTDKRNLLQFLDVVLVNSSGSGSPEEHKYYKKVKKAFTDMTSEDYKKVKGYLGLKLSRYNDDWFMYDFGNKDSYSRFLGETNSLVDGVWKSTFSPLAGKPSLVRDGTQVLWTHENNNKNLTSAELFEFDADKLLVLHFGDVEGKYFHKLKTANTWTDLQTGVAFDTKANELKAKFFTTPLEYDLAMKPDYNKFLVKRKTLHNVSDLTFNPTRAYSLNKLRFGDQVLWTSHNKENRVHTMRLTLLGYEVKAVQFGVTKGATKLDPDYDVYYFHKDISNTFKPKNKNEYKTAVESVKSSADRSGTFEYSDSWQRVASRLDLATYTTGEFTVETDQGTHGFVTESLTPRQHSWFATLGYCTVDMWPPHSTQVTNPAIKKVVLFKKNSLLQLVQLTAAGTVTAEHSGAVDSDYYFKKSGDTYVSVGTAEEFERLKSTLQQEGQLTDDQVHLDLNKLELNEVYYTLTDESVDGVNKRVINVKTLKVTKLTNFTNELWTRPTAPPNSEAYVTGYEMYTFREKKLLKVLVSNGAPTDNTTWEKTGENVEWAKFTENFNAKLLSVKNVSTWASVELDVSVKPVLADFDVVVTPVKGNRTKLLLTPKSSKKVTKVKLGTTKEFFTTDNSNRAYKVELHLETYEPKFVKVFVWKDAGNESPVLTVLQFFKDGDNWLDSNLEEKLRAYEALDNKIPFTYSENWVRPPSTFDPKVFSATYFASADETGDLVKTTTYTPRAGTVVKKVSLFGDKVWPDGADDVQDPTKKLVELKVLSKNDMIQLVYLKNALVAAPGTEENLYYKKVTDRYEKLADAKFDELKKSLAKPGEYVDDKVKLDLSASEEASTKLFEKETTLEDGVQKTIVKVKAGKLFEVSASPTLWKSTNGSYVTVLERYALDGMQLLVLHITNADGSTEKQYFEKPLSLPPAPEEPRVSTGVDGRSADQGTHLQGQQESQVQEQQHGAQVQQEVVPPKPSFQPLSGKSAFFEKLNTAKSNVEHQHIELDVKAYSDDSKFEVKQATEGTATLFKVYPKKTFRIFKLVNGSETKLWERGEDGERLVEAFLYLHDSKMKFVRAVVWAKDHTDESKDKLLHYKLENESFVEKTPEVFAKELRELTAVPPRPLATENIVQPAPTPSIFHKFYLSESVDSKVFELTERKKNAYKLKNYTPKQDKFVNLVETQHGVLWKAEDGEDLLKSTFFAVTENSALAHLTLSVNSQPMDMFFKFEDDRWHNLDNKTYAELCTKAGVPSS